MKRTLQRMLMIVAAAMFVSISVYAQPLSGTYTIAGSSPDFATLSAAISALNSRGVSGPVDFEIRSGSYSGTSWMGVINNITGASATNRIVFKSQTNSKGDVTITNNSSSNYIVRFNSSQYITFQSLTFVKNTTSYGCIFDFGSTTASHITVTGCTLTGNGSTSSTTTNAMVYAYGHTGTNNLFSNCEFINGSSFFYWRGSSTSAPSRGLKLYNNTFTANSYGYYGLYTYYTADNEIVNNTLTRSGSGVYYANYTYYNNDNYTFTGNTFDVSATSTLYFYQYYLNYSNPNASAVVLIDDNDITLTNTSGTTYAYTHYGYYCTKTNNDIQVYSTTGSKYISNLYYFYNSEAYDNDYISESTSSGLCYYYDQYYGNSSVSHDNTVRMKTTSYVYMYMVAYGSQNEMYNNRIDVDITSSYVYTYAGYDCGGGTFRDNEVNINITTGTLYGVRPGYNAGNVYNNRFNFAATSGTVYGLYPYYMSTGYVYNNVVNIKSTGTVYNMYPYYCTGGVVANNTVHNNGTGSNSYLLYDYSYNKGNLRMFNNILTRTTASSNMMYTYNAENSESDYNLYYTPGSVKYQSNTSPSTTESSLHEWRKATGREMNTLFFEPPYTDAANGDFSIIPTSTGAWAINGRGVHDTTIKTDFANVNRPIFTTAGVPDLGAYEVTPTSTPPFATATPASPVANSTQSFIFAEDTVATIDWGAVVPSSYNLRQYTGMQAAPMPAGVGRMFFYVAPTANGWLYPHKANVRYKDPWIGDIPTEGEAVIARSSNGGAWEGYNFSNSITDLTRNILAAATPLDSIGAYTGVQNGRIGIRCVEDPKNILISNITAAEADIDWDPVFNPIGYQVVFKKVFEAPTQAEWDNAAFPTSNSIAANGLDEDTKYYVFIRSVCGVKDTSGYSADSFATIITCHEPAITISNVSDSRAVASWSSVKTAVKYEYALTATPTPPAYGTDVTKLSILEAFLEADKQYYVHVKAHCNTVYTESAWSTQAFKTWPLGISDVDGSSAGLQVYPNPAQDVVSVVIGGKVAPGASVVLTDIAGKTLKAIAVASNNIKVNVSELPAGMYILHYADELRTEQVKLNKE